MVVVDDSLISKADNGCVGVRVFTRRANNDIQLND